MILLEEEECGDNKKWKRKIGGKKRLLYDCSTDYDQRNQSDGFREQL